jgi:hypothetical protein
MMWKVCVVLLALSGIVSSTDFTPILRRCCPLGQKFDVEQQDCVKDGKILNRKTKIQITVNPCEIVGTVLKKSNNIDFHFDDSNIIVKFLNESQEFTFDNYCMNPPSEVIICDQKVAFVKTCCAENSGNCTKNLEIIGGDGKPLSNLTVLEVARNWDEQYYYSEDSFKLYQNGQLMVGNKTYENYCVQNDGRVLIGVSNETVNKSKDSLRNSLNINLVMKIISLVLLLCVPILMWKLKVFHLNEKLLVVYSVFLASELVFSILDDLEVTRPFEWNIPIIFSTLTASWLLLFMSFNNLLNEDNPSYLYFYAAPSIIISGLTAFFLGSEILIISGIKIFLISSGLVLCLVEPCFRRSNPNRRDPDYKKTVGKFLSYYLVYLWIIYSFNMWTQFGVYERIVAMSSLRGFFMAGFFCIIYSKYSITLKESSTEELITV